MFSIMNPIPSMHNNWIDHQFISCLQQCYSSVRFSYLKVMLQPHHTSQQTGHKESKKLMDVLMEEVQSPLHHSYSLFHVDWPHLQCNFPLSPRHDSPVHTPQLEALDQSMENYQQHPLLYQFSEKAQGCEEIIQTSKLTKKNSKRLNDTKNIPKNFGKGIINFIEQNGKKIKQILAQTDVKYSDFMKTLKNQKQSMHTIAELRAWWTDQKIGKIMRIVSNLFFRKFALSYIFNSRITSYGIHIKYRKILWESLLFPENFDHIKTY